MIEIVYAGPNIRFDKYEREFSTKHWNKQSDMFDLCDFIGTNELSMIAVNWDWCTLWSNGEIVKLHTTCLYHWK